MVAHEGKSWFKNKTESKLWNKAESQFQNKGETHFRNTAKQNLNFKESKYEFVVAIVD